MKLVIAFTHLGQKSTEEIYEIKLNLVQVTVSMNEHENDNKRIYSSLFRCPDVVLRYLLVCLLLRWD